MRRIIWTFVMLLLSAVVGVSAVPQTDRPETSYDETDTPVNQARPDALCVRVVRPPSQVTIRPQERLQAELHVPEPIHGLLLTTVPARRDLHPLRDLLCTLLI